MSTEHAPRLAKRLRRLFTKSHIAAMLESPAETPPEDLAKYRDDPVGFAREVLGVELTPDQQRMIQRLPGRLKIESGHNIGKSFMMAVIALWWFYTRNPSIVVCNAPKYEHLCDVLWSEIRMLVARAKVKLKNFFVGPKAPEMFDNPDHWCKGYTTSKGEAYQGRHRESMLFLFDEDEGIDHIYWTTTGTMYQPDGTHGWVASCNPVTTSSQSSRESMLTDADGNMKWQLFTISSMDHPNIAAELAGNRPVVPNAVSLGQIQTWLKDWTTPVEMAEDRQLDDVEFPPASGRFYRPGPTFKARVQGKRPSGGIDSCWSLDAWNKAITPKITPQECWLAKCGIQIGLDASGYGDDDTVFHVRSGPLSLHHEARNGWSPDRAAERLKELCRFWAAQYNTWACEPRPHITATTVSVTLEFDGGYGVGVHSHRGDFHNWRGVTVGGSSQMLDSNGQKQFANIRAELWLESSRKALMGKIDLSRLSVEVLDRLRLQLLSPYFEVRPDGSRLVEPKKDVKERIGRSPDDADAFILSHYDTPNYSTSLLTKQEEAW